MKTNGCPRFSLDSSLGRLARWLRLLGHDAAWQPGDDLQVALARARTDGRCVLTRSRGLHKLGLELPPGGGLVIRSDDLRDQLVEMGRQWPIFQNAAAFTRCADCNVPLEDADPDWARQRVPPYVAQSQSAFRSCPSCGKIFWSATHTGHIATTLREAADRSEQQLTLDPHETCAGPDNSDPAHGR